MRRFRISALALLIAAALAPAGRAEEQKDTTWTLSAEARVRPEYRDDADFDSDVDDDSRLGFLRLRIGLDFAWKREIRVFAQIQDSRAAGEEITTTADRKNVDLHQGYAELTPAAWNGVSLRIGRQEWAYGEHRLIGTFDWNNVGRAFDGARVRWTRSSFTLDGLAARLSSVSTTTPPSAPPAVGSSFTTGSDLFGIYAHRAPRAGDELDVYWLEFADHAQGSGEVPMTTGTTRIDAFGVRVKETAGKFDLVFEGVAETGEVNGDGLSAGAAAIQIGWSWGDAVTTRLFGGYDYATGDENPGDGEREEFFNFFPTNHPLYGYIDYFGWRNIDSPYAGVSFKGGRHFGLVKGHVFDLESARGAWKNDAGDILGLDGAGTSGTRVGTEVDLLYRFAWTEKATFEAGVARFDPGEFAEATRGPDASDWAYVSLTVRM